MALLHEAMELSTPGSHENRAAALVLQLHAGCRGDPVREGGQPPVDQDSALGSTDEAPWILGIQLLHSFEQFGDLADLQEAITLMEELVRSTSTSDDRYSAALGDLGLALSYRFDHVGELSDLEEAISRLRDAVNLTPHGYPHKRNLLNNLYNSFRARFRRLGQLSDLEDAISTLKDAVQLTPHGDHEKARMLNNLGSSLLARFERLGG